MSLVFNPSGHMVVVDALDSTVHEPASISISSLENPSESDSWYDLKAYILTAEINKRVINQKQKSLNNKLYFYSFGTEFAPIKIMGIAYVPASGCETPSPTTDYNGATLLLEWFDEYNADNTSGIPVNNKKLTITYGGKTMEIFLEHIAIKKLRGAYLPLFQFALQGTILTLT
jgi:hypothetical protein